MKHGNILFFMAIPALTYELLFITGNIHWSATVQNITWILIIAVGAAWGMTMTPTQNPEQKLKKKPKKRRRGHILFIPLPDEWFMVVVLGLLVIWPPVVIVYTLWKTLFGSRTKTLDQLSEV